MDQLDAWQIKILL